MGIIVVVPLDGFLPVVGRDFLELSLHSISSSVQGAHVWEEGVGTEGRAGEFLAVDTVQMNGSPVVSYLWDGRSSLRIRRDILST